MARFGDRTIVQIEGALVDPSTRLFPISTIQLRRPGVTRAWQVDIYIQTAEGPVRVDFGEDLLALGIKSRGNDGSRLTDVWYGAEARHDQETGDYVPSKYDTFICSQDGGPVLVVWSIKDGVLIVAMVQQDRPTMASPENPRGITWNAPRGYQGKAKGLDAANAELREEMGLVLSTTDARGQSHPLTPLPGVAQNQDTAWFNHNLLDENGDCQMVDGEIVRGGLLPMGLPLVHPMILLVESF
jgi:hypothetical protein